jgi:phage shock protein A
MSLWKRIGRVLTGKAHQVVEDLEDPSLIADQILREMDEKIRIANSGLIEVNARLNLVEADEQSAVNNVVKWEDGARSAAANGQKDLALKCAERAKASRSEADAFKAQREMLEAEVKRLQGQIDDAYAQRNKAVSNVQVMKTQLNVAQATQKVAEAVSGANMSDQLSDLGAMQRKVQEQTAKAQAAAEENDRKSGADIERQLEKLNEKSAEDTLAEILARPN